MARRTDMTEQIYRFIKGYMASCGYAPSVRDICAGVGLKSPSTVHFHLNRLQEMGLIERGERKGRAVTLVEEESGAGQIPVVGSVAAGSPILAEESIEEYVSFDCGGNEGQHFALRVRGESMKNAGILPGDLVVVRRQQVANNGEIVVALLGDEATVKRFSCRSGKVWLLPENEDYQPIDGTHASILGRVVAVIRRYE